MDVVCKLQNFAIITYAVSPERFNGLIPPRFKLDTVVINGEERTSIVADYGTNIEWMVSAPNRGSKSGSLILTEDTSLNVSLDASEHTFVIVAVPSDAIVKSTNKTALAPVFPLLSGLAISATSGFQASPA